MYLSAPLVFGAFKKWPHLRRPSCIVGLFIMCIALAASSFSTKVGHLMFTQGIIYAIGGSLAYTPVILFMDEWFIKNKGFAYGVMWVCVFTKVLLTSLTMNRLEQGYQATIVHDKE